VATRAYEAHGAQPYGPLIDVLRADVMRPSIAALDPGLRRELGRVLPEATSDEPAVESPGRETQRRRLFEAIGRVLVGGRRVLVLVIDDLHWCDPDTLELLEFVIRSASSSPNPLLVVATIRQEELISQPTLRPAVSRLCAASEAAAELSLGRLDAVDAAELVTKVTGERVTGSAFERLIASAEGNPLFLVEMARSGLLRGSSPTTELHLPPKVQAVIDTRLDQLSETARDLASVTAVVGRSFTVDLIGNLVTDGRDAMTALDELWRRGIIRERGPERYDFSHDRIRDVAYHRLGPAHRRTLHAAVAVALEHGGGAEPGQIADHLERAGQIEAAIATYQRAVDIAARAFAHQDVIGHCRRGLRLVAGRPPGPSRDDVELAFLVPLGAALMTGPGVADADLNVYERAHALRTQRGLAADPSTLRLWANAAIGRRDYPKARRLGETLLRRGCDEHDRVLITEGHYLIGVTSFWLGDLDVSRRSLEDALASHQPRHTPVHLERFGQDPRTVCLVRLALTSFHLGDETTAAERCAEALEASAGVGHEYTDVYVRMFAAWYLVEAGREDEAAQLVDRMPAATPNPMASIARAQFTGWARSRRGDPASGARLLRDAQHEAHHRGPQMFEPFTLILLARSCLAAGDLSEALDAALAARAIAASEMPFHLPEATAA